MGLLGRLLSLQEEKFLQGCHFSHILKELNLLDETKERPITTEELLKSLKALEEQSAIHLIGSTESLNCFAKIIKFNQ